MRGDDFNAHSLILGKDWLGWARRAVARHGSARQGKENGRREMTSSCAHRRINKTRVRKREMHTAIATIEGMSPYSPSAYYKVDSGTKETHEDKERRTWRERIHATNDGHVFMPPMGFKHALVDAARFLGHKIKGRGHATYTKRFTAGVLCFEPLVLDVKKTEVPGEWLFVPSDGKAGGGKRVEKCFGRIDEWGGDVTFQVIDDLITEDIFREHFEAAGTFVGVGRFRPQSNGFYGRFRVTDLIWD